MKAKVSFKGKDSWLPKEDLLPTRQEGILFTIDCLNSHKYNFDYNLEELIKEAKQLQSNWNSLRELIEKEMKKSRYNNDVLRFTAYEWALDKMGELEGNTYEEN